MRKTFCFPEDAVHHSVQCLRCGKILSERFLDYDARALGATRFAEPMNDGLEQDWAGWRDSASAASRCPVSAATPEKSPHRNSRRQCSPCRRLKRLKASGSKPPYRSTLSRARDLSWSSVQPALATPITGMSRLPRLASDCRAGNIFLWARSPVAPKKTSASEERSVWRNAFFHRFGYRVHVTHRFLQLRFYFVAACRSAQIRICIYAFNFWNCLGTAAKASSGLCGELRIRISPGTGDTVHYLRRRRGKRPLLLHVCGRNINIGGEI